ncbi:hypothetical protein BKN14_04660 [Candidatus Gracilibacteria bacterium HOT-871]|nr:hypothetical protein BKN14_04660 [Candidatus Gracilibacteria bacterium HOT-871]RKW23040.1 MAG: hypothetical protein D8B46_04120 [Candidatus Gracilibacteria bacterium]
MQKSLKKFLEIILYIMIRITFIIVTIIFYYIYTIMTRVEHYNIIAHNGEVYSVYLGSILGFFGTVPFTIRGLRDGLDGNPIGEFYLFDIYKLSWIDIFAYLGNLLVYFLLFYLVFRNDLKKLLPKNIFKNKYLDFGLKSILILIYYLIYLKLILLAIQAYFFFSYSD